jgi:hypothetical protein
VGDSIEEAVSIAQGQTVSAPMRVGSIPCDALFFFALNRSDLFVLTDRPGNVQRSDSASLDRNDCSLDRPGGVSEQIDQHNMRTRRGIFRSTHSRNRSINQLFLRINLLNLY